MILAGKVGMEAWKQGSRVPRFQSSRFQIPDSRFQNSIPPTADC
jgi:hypothetical protein